MLKGPQYKKIVLAQWMRIVGVFWLVVSNLAIVCYVGPRVAFCIFEMLLLYWDVVAYSTFSGIATSSFSPLIFILYFAAVIKVRTRKTRSYEVMLGPGPKMLSRSEATRRRKTKTKARRFASAQYLRRKTALKAQREALRQRT